MTDDITIHINNAGPQQWLADHNTPTLRAPRRAWFCEGYDDGAAWVRRFLRDHNTTPDISRFRDAQYLGLVHRGLSEHFCRPLYEQGFDAAYCDGLDIHDADLASQPDPPTETS